MKKLLSFIAILSMTSIALVSCEDEFDYYTTTEETDGAGGTGGTGGTGGNGGNGGNGTTSGNGFGDGTCFVSKQYLDGELSAEYFYDSLYIQMDSMHLYMPLIGTLIRHIYNYDGGVLVSMDQISDLGSGMGSTAHTVFTYDSQNRLDNALTTMDQMGIASELNQDYIYDPAVSCGIIGMNGTQVQMGMTTTFNWDIEYLDNNCSYLKTIYQAGQLSGTEKLNMVAVPDLNISPATPEAFLIMSNVYALPTSWEAVTFDGLGNSMQIDHEFEYTYDADGNISEITSIMTTDGQNQTYVNSYTYVCP
mgnify:CR=1 FL=1